MITSHFDQLRTILADRYQLERELGQGGMATVYLAEDLKHGRKVAIKVLRPELAAVIGADRFVREIRTVAALQHPHILGLIDSGEIQGTAYYVMPFVEGESLRDRLTREKQLPVSDAIRIGTEVASALDYAHRHGVIHRDIKPENILLHEGQALVADFGIALALSTAGGTRMTETGMSLGTPHYMSPEQAMGEREITARSDVYALGCVIYEMLLGEPPFTGPTAQAIVAKVVTEEPRPLRIQRRTVPEPVEDAVLTALAKLPADRFGTAHEFAAALRISAGPSSTAVTAMLGRRRLRTALLLAGAALVAVLVGVPLLGPGRPAAPVATTRRLITSSGAATQPALSPDGRMVGYVLNGTDVMVQDLAGGDPLPIVRGARVIRYPRWTPDGTALLFLGEIGLGDGGLFIVPRLGGAPRKLAEPSMAFAVHPNGEEVLVSRLDALGESTLFRVRLKDGTVMDTLWRRDVRPIAPPAGAEEPQPLVFSFLEWSPNGRWIAFSALQRLPDDGAGVGVMNSSGVVLDVHPDWVGPLQWSPGSDAIYYFPDNTRAELDLTRLKVDRSGHFVGNPVVVLSRVPGLDGSLSVSSDGRTAAYTSGTANHHLSLLSIDPAKGTTALRKMTTGTAWHGQPTLAPDGRFIVYSKGDQRGDNLYRLPVDSGTERALTQTPDWNHRPKISPDGARLVFMRTDLETNRRTLLIIPADGGSSRALAAGQVDWTLLLIGVPWTWLDPGRILLRGDPAHRRYTVVDVDRGDTSTLALPDSLMPEPLMSVGADGTIRGVPWPLAAGPSRTGFAVVARVHDTLFLLRASPDLKQWTRLLAAAPGERVTTLRWADDGWIYFAHWAPADTAYWLSRVRATGGRAELRLPIPKSCSLGLERMSGDGRRLVCETPGSSTYDVWIAENFDPGYTSR